MGNIVEFFVREVIALCFSALHDQGLDKGLDLEGCKFGVFSGFVKLKPREDTPPRKLLQFRHIGILGIQITRRLPRC